MTGPTRRPTSQLACLSLLIGLAQPGSSGAAGVAYADVAALFAARCVMCHAGPAAPRGLRLDSLDAIQAGSDRGPVVRVGDPAGSELVRRIRGTSLPRMPMTGPPYLSEQEMTLIEDWVAAGLPEGAAVAPAAQGAPTVPAQGPVTFAQVAPIFATRCAKCHTDNGLMGPPPEGLRLTSYESILSAEERLRLVPGRPEASELVRRIRGQALPRMPFDGPPYLSEDETALIEKWIAEGARASDGRPAQAPAGAELRLHGQLSAYWALDGLELSVGPGARIRKEPQPGDYVEVRGRLGADGSVQAERIRSR